VIIIFEGKMKTCKDYNPDNLKILPRFETTVFRETFTGFKIAGMGN
jgi:hypothetical protein